jgi:hypothetical protein
LALAVAASAFAVTNFVRAQSAPAGRAPAARLDDMAVARIIDREIQRRLDAEEFKPSPLADDAEFLRRVSLDLIGVIPSADRVAAFLDDADPAKRAKVIDELLAHPRFGNYLGEVWAGLLLPQGPMRKPNQASLQGWLADNFNKNTPLDKLVYELLTATGTQQENPAVSYFIANPTADKITDNVCKMFLGVRLQCAQCHNHPFVDIKQTEYWGMAGFFMKVRTKGNPKQAAKKGAPVSIVEANTPPKGKKNALPKSAKVVSPRFFQGPQPDLKPGEPYRPVVARWMTSAENPFFAKAMVNRFWHQLFGRGIVNPVDDMHEANVPSHPELMAVLTEQLKLHNFDVKFLLRAICNSQVYQRTSRPFAGNKDDTEWYSHAAVRSLSPEQLFDSLTAIVGQPKGDGPKGKKAVGKKGPVGPREAFLAFFRIEDGANPLEYQAGIPQALRLMNSPQTAGNAVLTRILKTGQTPDAIIEQLYLTALSRRPTAQETTRLTEYVRGQSDSRAGYADIHWALLNSSEFALNH